MSSNKVTLYYDLISPWSYIAYHLIKRNEKAWNVQLILKPRALGYIFKNSSNRAPLVVPNKSLMMSQEFRLFCEYYKLPASPNAWTFSPEARSKPPNSLPLMRFLRTIEHDQPNNLESATTKLFDAIFAHGKTELFKCDPAALADTLGSDAESVKKMLEKAESKEYKDAVQAEAKEAVEKQHAYGVPWMSVQRADGETLNFMGSDRFELMAHWLGVQYSPAGGRGATSEQAKL